MIKINEVLTIELPGERTRALICKILSPGKIILELTSEPLAKSHSYRKGEFVACVRKKSIFGEFWQVVETKPNLEDFVEKLNVTSTRSNAGPTGKNSKKSGNQIDGAA